MTSQKALVGLHCTTSNDREMQTPYERERFFDETALPTDIALQKVTFHLWCNLETGTDQ